MIAHATNNHALRFVGAVLMSLSALSSGTVGAATKSYDTYHIERGWFDPDYIYILYKKSHQIVNYSLKDIEGTIAEKKSNFFITRTSRSALKDNTTISLEKGEPVSSMIYRDMDFTLSTSADKFKLTGSKASKTFDKCSSAIWSGQGAIRIGGQLFFCGIFFGKSGDPALEVPRSVTQTIEGKFQSNPSGNTLAKFIPAKPVSVVSSNKLLTTRIEPNDPVSELRIAVWPLASDQGLTWVDNPLPSFRAGYVLQNNFLAYSPTGFVLRPVGEGQWVLFCEDTTCKRINIAHNYSFLVVDGERKQIFSLVQKDPTSSSITFFVLTY